jgi:hypothetical protein
MHQQQQQQQSSSYPSYPGYPPSSTTTTNPTNSPYYPMPMPSSTPSTLTSTNQRQQSYDDTIKPEYFKLSLITAVIDKARSSLYNFFEEKRQEMSNLERTKQNLETNSRRIQSLIDETDAEKRKIERITEKLKKETNTLNDTLIRMSYRDKTDIDDAVVASRPLYRQIMHLFAEEMAIQDLIYYLNDGLMHKNVSLESFLKQVLNYDIN